MLLRDLTSDVNYSWPCLRGIGHIMQMI